MVATVLALHISSIECASIGVKLGEAGGLTVNGAEGKSLVDTFLLLL
jgi:hypothetical protein